MEYKIFDIQENKYLSSLDGSDFMVVVPDGSFYHWYDDYACGDPECCGASERHFCKVENQERYRADIVNPTIGDTPMNR